MANNDAKIKRECDLRYGIQKFSTKDTFEDLARILEVFFCYIAEYC